MGGYAWVTLATNDSYSLGALVLAHSLKKSNTAHKLAVLITPAVSQSMRDQLQTVFDVVKMVDVLDSKDEAHLALLKRPDLGITFTKIHCWRLVEFEKCVFLDADTLVVRNCDELFEREEFSAAPDVSWPDCFNSGVFVYRPSVETFNELLQFAVENRSFDGGDQGLLNQFFSNWATEDIKKHLPFVYNLTSIAAYSYIPAFKHYGSETRIVHFIGTGKPWLQQLDIATRTVTPSSGSEHLAPLLQQWWDLFCEKVHPNLDKNLESNNVGMSHPSVEACSNSLAIALTDESQAPHLIEPCTPYRQKDDFRQCNLPYQPFDVKGSSGELLNVEFLLASVVPPAGEEASSDEQQRRNGELFEEKNKTNWRDDETKNRKPMLERRESERLQNDSDTEQELICEHDKKRESVCATQQPEKTDERIDTSEEEQNLQQTEPPPPEDPFDYHSFFPDEICINNYLEQNVVTYQPFINSHHQRHDHHRHSKGSDETDISHGDKEPEKNIPSLPRFLTIPENDRRQSGNVETHPPEQYRAESIPILPACGAALSVEEHEHSQKESTPKKEEIQSERRQPEPILEKRELTKSKSMSHLVCDEPLWTLPRSVWKSQPDVNVDPNKKYSMPKLKPILPKQNSFSKSVSFVPKVTLYTEFLMSSEYKDPVDLPNDKEGFVKTHIHKEAKLKRSKSSVDVQSKFGPLPYVLSPELDKPITLKKTPLRLLDNELYDLSHCKRQLGNKPKSESSDRKKENVCSLLPALKPIVPAKDKKSTLMKKRKLKEPSPADGGREKIPKREPKIKEREVLWKREVKPTPRNVSTNANTNGDNLNEILKKLREFSKDYQHFFGVVVETKDKAVTCENSAVQKTEPGNSDCVSSRESESLSAPVISRVKATRVPMETRRESGLESAKNLNEDSVVKLKDKKETNRMGPTNKQDISSKSSNEEREAFKTHIEKLESGNRSHDLPLITKDAEGKPYAMLAKEKAHSKDKDKSSHPIKEYYTTQSHSGPAENGHVIRTPKLLVQKPVKSADPAEKSESCVQCRTENESLSAEINLPNLSAGRESNEVRVNDDIYWTTKPDSRQSPCCTSPSYASKTKAAEPKDLVSGQKIQQVMEDSESAKIPEGHKIPRALSADQLVNPKPLENKEMKKNGEMADDRTEKLKSSSVNNELPQAPGRVASAVFNKSNGHLSTKFSVGVQSSGINSPKQDLNGHKCKNGTHSKKKVINEKDSETARPVNHSSDLLNSKHLISTLEQPSQKGERNYRDEHCEYDRTTSNSNTGTAQKAASSVVKSSPKLTYKEKSDHSALQKNGAVKTKEKSSPAANDSKASTFDARKEKVGEGAKKVRDVPDFENPRSPYKTVAPELTEENSTAANYKDSENPLPLRAPNPSFSVPREVRKPQSGPRNIPERGRKNSEFFENRFGVLSNDFPDGTIRFVGKKTCDKKSERKTSSSPSPSTPNGGKAQPKNLEDLKSTAGIAGAIAQLSLEAGSEQNQESAAASAAHQEYLRRQNWETGNMDYMGRDSFDNIWLKICQTLEAKDAEETAGSPKTPTETSAKTEEGGKTKEVAPTEKPVSLSAILQNCSEYIETLPSEQASGPIEDDEIIFSKPENRRSSLTNIVEEEEVSMEVPESGVAKLITENLKPLQISQPNRGVDEMGTSVTETSSKCQKPQDELSPKQPKACEVKETDAKEEEAKIITGASHAGEEKTSLGSPAATVTEVKTQPQTEKEECKISTADQPPASSQEQLSTDEQKQSETLVEDKKGAVKPAEQAEECKVVAIPSPPIVFPGAPFTEKDKTSKRLKTEGKPDVFSEPIPLPPPESPKTAPTQEPAAKCLKSDSSKGDGKPKKGVFTKILEMVGVSPKEKTENELSKSVFYGVEGGVSSKEETDVMEKQVPKVEKTREPPAVAEPKQSDDVTEAKQQPAEEVEQEKATPPGKPTKTKELLPSKQEEIASKATADSEVALKAPEVKESIETQEQKPLELRQSEKSEERKPHPKESDKKGGSKSKSQNEQKSGQESISKPARNSSSKEPKQSTESKQSAAKRKSPNKKLTMPQKPPETEVTTPTPPPQPDVPPRRNSALLKVDDTVLETPPVPELSEMKPDEKVEGKVMTEIDDIIGKTKSEVETLLQDLRSAEKEAGESSDLINTMKLIMGDEIPVKTRTPEEVEELRVTTEEERERHKEEVVSSKLSDQILKAIPPPRRKAISEASASTSAIPKSSAAPEQKNPPGESKSKSSKPSSVPVPPPRNRGKPTQPAPSKGKGKK